MDNLHNFTLKIAVLDIFNGPKQDYCSNVYSNLQPALVILCEIVKYFRIKVEFITPQIGTFGNCNSTACDGLVGLLQTHKAHVAGSTLIPTGSRLQHIHAFTAGFKYELGFIYADKLSDNVNFEATFNHPFETTPLLCLLVMFISFWFLRKASNLVHNNLEHSGVLWSSFAQFLGQAEIKNVALLFCLTQMCVWYYAGCRGQVLKETKPKKAFSSITELSALIKSKEAFMVEQSEGANKRFFSIRNPEFIDLLKIDEFKPLIKPISGNGAKFVCDNEKAVAFSRINVKQYPPCDQRVLLLDQSVNPFQVFAISKSNFLIKKQLMNHLKNWNENISIEKKIFPRMYKNLNDIQKRSQQFTLKTSDHAVKLASLKYAFRAMMQLYALSAFILFIELAIFRDFLFRT